MTGFDAIVALGFCLVVFVTGLSFSRSGASANSFFAGGGAVPWWVNGVSLYMSFFSVGTFVVWGGIAYTDGLVAVSIQTTMAVAGVIIGLFIAPRWNRTSALTAAEFIGERLGDKMRKTYTVLFLIVSLFTAGNFLYPVGKIIEVSTGVPLETAILTLGILILIYTAVGGLWAVLVTDVLQFVVLSVGVLILVPLTIGVVGGVDEFVKRAPEGFFALQSNEYNWAFLLAFLVYNTIYIGGNWAYVQRFTSVADPASARKVGWLFAALYSVSPFVWMLPPMVFRVLQPELSGLENEGAYLLVSKLVVPAGLLGLILASMVFATASSVNTTLNISSGVFTNDLYRFLRPSASNRETMIVARAATIMFGAMTISVALAIKSMGGIVEVVFSVAAITGAAIFLPPIWAMFSRRQNAFSIFSATAASLTINLYFKFFAAATIGVSLSRTQEMLLGVAGPVVVLATYELIYALRGYVDPRNAEYQALRERKASEKRMRAASEESHAVNYHGVRVISFGVLAIGALVALLGLNSGDSRLLVSGLGVLVTITALVCLMRIRSGRMSAQGSSFQ